MPEFHLDTSGSIRMPFTCDSQGRVTVDHGLRWRRLDAFTQGYVEALFFTECEHGLTRDGEGAREWDPATDSSLPEDVAFADLAPGAMESIGRDCDAFQAGAAWQAFLAADLDCDDVCEREAQAGRDFWFTRNGHGCGFWDGDWPEPHATALSDAAHAFGEVWIELGDDGRVYARFNGRADR